jgi:hypothetical protein
MSLPNVETDEQTKLAIIDQNHRLAAYEIRQAYDQALELADQAKGDALGAIKAAQRCGAMLNAKKAEIEKTNKGTWLNWLETYLPEIQRATRTLQRWMQLSQRASHCDALEKAKPKSLRQAYIAVGIFPDPVVGQRKRLNGQDRPLKPAGGSSLVVIINEFRAQKPIEVLSQTQDFSSWDEVELETVIRLLAPITEARSRMIHALSTKLRQ